MKVKDVQEAIGEAQRFIAKAKACLWHQGEDQKAYPDDDCEYWEPSAETAACRRASMDLTRALSKMRKP